MLKMNLKNYKKKLIIKNLEMMLLMNWSMQYLDTIMKSQNMKKA